MRTVDATLLAALAAGNGRPIVKATIGKMDGTVIHTQEVVSYKLTALKLEFEMKYTGDLGSTQTAIWLERGVTLNGVDYTVTTGKFRIWSQTYLPNGRQRTVGGIFPKQYYSAAGDVSYQTVIAAICTAFGKTAVFRDPAAAWLAYQFLPAGKVLIMNDANNIFNMLRQKYLIFACDNGSEEIFFYALNASGIGAADETVTVNADFDLQLSKLKNRQFLWRDEVETIHTQGSADDPIHNLGYLESTDSAPARMTPTYIMSATTRPRLDVQDGDIVSLEMPLATSKMFALVTEEYDAGSKIKAPTWRTLIEANPIFENTEGGALPSTIERVSNYTPLNTSMFDGNLSASDNNLQAAMDTIDNLVHWLPFGVYVDLSPMTPGTKYPYTTSLSRSITLHRWTQFYIVLGTNNSSNYWRIRIVHYNGSALVKEIDTRTAAPITITTFDISYLTPAMKGLYMECIAVGAPGNLLLIGPALEING